MEILEMKSTVTETKTKNVFNKLINKLGITKQRIFKLEDRPIQIIWTEMQKKNHEKIEQSIF